MNTSEQAIQRVVFGADIQALLAIPPGYLDPTTVLDADDPQLNAQHWLDRADRAHQQALVFEAQGQRDRTMSTNLLAGATSFRDVADLLSQPSVQASQPRFHFQPDSVSDEAFPKSDDVPAEYPQVWLDKAIPLEAAAAQLEARARPCLDAALQLRAEETVCRAIAQQLGSLLSSPPMEDDSAKSWPTVWDGTCDALGRTYFALIAAEFIFHNNSTERSEVLHRNLSPTERGISSGVRLESEAGLLRHEGDTFCLQSDIFDWLRRADTVDPQGSDSQPSEAASEEEAQTIHPLTEPERLMRSVVNLLAMLTNRQNPRCSRSFGLQIVWFFLSQDNQPAELRRISLELTDKFSYEAVKKRFLAERKRGEYIQTVASGSYCLVSEVFDYLRAQTAEINVETI